MATKKKAKKVRHRGVVLLRPEPSKRMGWRGRFRDPDTGRMLKVTLTEHDAHTDETRTAWAVRKSKELIVRHAQLDGGATPISRNAITDAVDGYYKSQEHELKESTTTLYKVATGHFLAWARARNIVNSADLTAPRLANFRDYLIAQRARTHARVEGGRKAARKEGKRKLSPKTINWQLRTVKTVLNYLRARGQVKLSSDQIRDALKPAKVPKEAPEFLRPAELVQLIEACIRHDNDKYVETRDEHIGERAKGSTYKYTTPIGPFAVTVLLSGMRLGEALSLRWAAVDLNALNADGKAIGEIRLRGTETKTAHARTITLDVSPSLRRLLVALKVRAGKDEYVFGGTAPLAKTMVEAARRRLVETYGAPKNLSWQLLRSTCATYGTNAGGVFGASAAFASAKRLGHSVQVAEKHYADQFAVSRDATTLEQAMTIEALMPRVIERVSVAARPKLAAVGR